MLGYLAQWVDIGFDHPSLVQRLLGRFSETRRSMLPLGDYVQLRMAEALVAMAEEDFDRAIQRLEFIPAVERDLRDQELVAICNFWIGRCQRRKGRYDDALTYTLKGKNLALELGFPKMAAVMQVLESWLIFQRGRSDEAAKTLKEAETALLETDDYVSRGNIQSAYGRMARRLGQYDLALRHFANSIEEYRKRDAQHRNLARSLSNMAFVKRLLALRLRKKIDQGAARRGKAGRKAGLPAGGPFQGRLRPLHERARFERLREEALADLAEAHKIYAALDDHRGAGNVHIIHGYIYLDGGDLDRAAREGEAARQFGYDKHDALLAARARILQCFVENAKFEEQIDEGAGPGHHAPLAGEWARDALERAQETQNRRLLAKAQLALGLTLCNDFFNDPENAQRCCDQAAALLKPEGQDYVWEDLQALRSKLLKAGGIDRALRDWSEGRVGDKTFQQITEEFAGIVIPRVWNREGRKVSRVAKRLSVSPKKVRRILAKSGLS
ncbi:MAG: hypothetical protein ACREH9_05280, partial [Pseudomonadota bacterium]